MYISGNDRYVGTVDSLSSSSIYPVVSCIHTVKQQVAEHRSLTCLAVNTTNKLFICHDNQLIIVWCDFDTKHTIWYV